MYLKTIKSYCKFASLFLLIILVISACSAPEVAETKTQEAVSAIVPQPTVEATPEPLPEIGELSAAWDGIEGVELIWKPFDCNYNCVLERKDAEKNDFSIITDIDTSSGGYTDKEPVKDGTLLVYRLSISDGENNIYSQEASILVPFTFGNTGGNLANGGITCDANEAVYRIDIAEGKMGIFKISNDSVKSLLVEGFLSQLNVSDGYMYYLFDVNNRNRSGLLNRMPIDGSAEPQQLYDKKMVFVLTVGDRIYCTLDNGGELIVMNNDGTGIETLVDKGCYDLGGSGNMLYYTNKNTKLFCMLNLLTGETTSFPLKDRGFAQIYGDRVYYQNEGDNKKLYSCALDGSDTKKLLDSPVTGININEKGIYCVNSNDSKPYLVAFDGSDTKKLADIKVDYIAISGLDVLLYDVKGNFYIMDETGEVTKIET